MAGEILVGFATRSGSTQEVAEAVADSLRGKGMKVDLQPLRSVRSLAGYRMLVLGAPLYMFRWHKDATNFLSRHKEALNSCPSRFSPLAHSMTKKKNGRSVRTQFDKELAKSPWFAPVAREVFGGRFDPAKLRFPFNLIPALKKMPASDIRNWDAIRAWTDGLED